MRSKRGREVKNRAETQSNKDWRSRGRVLPLEIHGGRVFDSSASAGERASAIPHARERGKKKKETQTDEGKKKGDEKRRKEQL